MTGVNFKCYPPCFIGLRRGVGEAAKRSSLWACLVLSRQSGLVVVSSGDDCLHFWRTWVVPRGDSQDLHG
jgi:hypothetical protein